LAGCVAPVCPVPVDGVTAVPVLGVVVGDEHAAPEVPLEVPEVVPEEVPEVVADVVPELVAEPVVLPDVVPEAVVLPDVVFEPVVVPDVVPEPVWVAPVVVVEPDPVVQVVVSEAVQAVGGGVQVVEAVFAAGTPEISSTLFSVATGR
jgi:hypothetical protein